MRLLLCVFLLLGCINVSFANSAFLETTDIIAAKMLKAEEFAKLNHYLDTILSQPLATPSYGVAVGDVLYAFVFPSSWMGSTIEEWRQEYPAAYQPLLAQGVYYFNRGVNSRGSAYARDTTAEQFRGMREYFNKSIDCFNKAIELKPTLTSPYSYLITMQMAMGNSAECRRLLTEVLSISDIEVAARSAYLESLLPKWGGSYDEMNSFIEETRPFFSKNPRLKFLEGYQDIENGYRLLHPQTRDLEKSLKTLDKALSYGSRRRTHRYKAMCLELMGRLEEAYEEIQLALDTCTYSERSLWVRIRLSQKLKKRDAAIQDLEAVLLLDPKNKKALDKIAYLYGEVGRKTDSLQSYKVLKSLEPKNMFYRHKYRELLGAQRNAIPYGQ
jgi:tetratricopeptide (TPR) repeat protein